MPRRSTSRVTCPPGLAPGPGGCSAPTGCSRQGDRQQGTGRGPAAAPVPAFPSAVPLKENLRAAEGSLGTEDSKSTARSVSCQAESSARQHCLQAWAHGLCPTGTAARPGLRPPLELLGVSGAQHPRAGVSVPEEPRRAACPGDELSSRGVPRLPAADSDKTRLKETREQAVSTSDPSSWCYARR
ncbi:hypothetical protein Nmel_001343 [Mimus melanotis]